MVEWNGISVIMNLQVDQPAQKGIVRDTRPSLCDRRLCCQLVVLVRRDDNRMSRAKPSEDRKGWGGEVRVNIHSPFRRGYLEERRVGSWGSWSPRPKGHCQTVK